MRVNKRNHLKFLLCLLGWGWGAAWLPLPHHIPLGAVGEAELVRSEKLIHPRLPVLQGEVLSVHLWAGSPDSCCVAGTCSWMYYYFFLFIFSWKTVQVSAPNTELPELHNQEPVLPFLLELPSPGQRVPCRWGSQGVWSSSHPGNGSVSSILSWSPGDWSCPFSHDGEQIGGGNSPSTARLFLPFSMWLQGGPGCLQRALCPGNTGLVPLTPLPFSP